MQTASLDVPDGGRFIDSLAVRIYGLPTMTAIAKQLDAKLKLWRSPTAHKVEQLVADIIALADRERPAAKTARKPAARNRDAFLADKKLFPGRTPRDLAASHDRYL